MERKEALISLIVPVYNVEKYLNKCIKTITEQTYKNIEVILVDDGSNDKSGQICDEWAKTDYRIKVIHKENGGLSDARNVGLKSSAGHLVGFIDSDDYIDKDMIEKLFNALIYSQADIAICDFYFEDEDGKTVPGFTKTLQNEVLSSEEALKKLVTNNNFYYVTAVNRLYKKELFDDFQFPIGRIHEDEFTAHHLFLKCKKIVIIENQLYHYLQRNDSITHNTFTIKRIDGIYALLDRFYFFNKLNLKKEADFSLKQAYSLLLTIILKLPVIENKNVIKKVLLEIIRNLKLNLRSFKLFFVYYKKIMKEYGAAIKFFIRTGSSLFKNRHVEKIILMGTPTHGNLGDQAIVYAEYKLLSKYFSEKKIIEVYSVDYLRYKNIIQKWIHVKDIIVIDGGGNLGSLWPKEDDKITDIISCFYKNTIIIFPQTCFYDSSFNSRTRINKNREIYSKCLHLHIMLRDLNSYKLVDNYFPDVKKYYVPDIVLKLENQKYKYKRDGILLCFRQDHEKVITDINIASLKKYLDTHAILYKSTSTVISSTVKKNNRNIILEKKWKEFAKAKLVITDRLHGMIFAAITSTPCIALDNRSKKVSGVYEWIRDLSYIKCKADFNEIYEEIPALYNMEEQEYTLNHTADEFCKVISSISELID